MNSIPTVFTDDDDEDDSLSKSIASECSSSDSSDSSCDTSNFSGNEAGSSSSPNEIGQDIVMESEIDNLNEDKPWIVNQNTSSTEPNNEPQLSVEPNVCNHDISIAFEFINNPQCLAQEIVDSKDGEAPVSSSAFRSYLSNRLEQTDLPPSALETIDYSRNNDGNIEQTQHPELNQNKQPQQSNKGVGQKGRNRRLHSIRRKLQQFKVDFEQENGYRPSYEQKMASSFARPLMLELNQLESCECVDSKSEDQQLISLAAKSRSGVNQWKQPPSPSSTTTTETDTLLSTEDIFNTIFGNPNEKSLTKISEMMDEIQRTLEEKRSASCRPESLDEMTSEQIFDEKLALQKALLRFEANNGRPNSKAERDIVRPVYDRYRLVKRYASRILQRLGSKDAINELQPILEHVQMDFKSPTHSCSNIETTTDETNVVTKSSSSGQVSLESCDMSNSANVIEALVDSNKNFHVMSREELLIQLRECRQHKRNLRAVLRTFENDFYKKTGRRVEKEDRCNMATVYHCYKNTKGKIRLLEALVAKCDRERNELSHKNV
ncbi:Protein fam13a [Blomia tropicalis]|nr:Protein fam13a [Blomia tropicalis]